MCYLLFNMNDLIDIQVEELITPEIEAQLEHARGQRESEARERTEAWECLAQNHNRGERLFTPREWGEHCADLNDQLDWVGDAFQSATEWE